MEQGYDVLVRRGREVESNSAGFKVLGKSLIKPLDRFSKEGIVRYIVSLPLNSIPVVGTVFFLIYNGTACGGFVDEKPSYIPLQESNRVHLSMLATSNSKASTRAHAQSLWSRGRVHIPRRSFLSCLRVSLTMLAQLRRYCTSAQPRPCHRPPLQLDLYDWRRSLGKQT